MSKGFSGVPQVRFNRSKFDLTHSLKTSFNIGELVPLDLIEVLPGDTFKVKTGAVVRTTTSFIRPVMDDCFMDIHHFFIPYRLCYDNAERVWGNPNPSAYIDEDLDEFPTIFGQVAQNSVGDYLGLPINKDFNGDNKVSALPFRAFALVYNQWFRNQNVSQETFVHTDKTEVSMNNDEWSENNYTGKLPKVSKLRDLFTSCIPNPQKGAPVQLSLGAFAPIGYKSANSNSLSAQAPLFLGSSPSPYPVRALFSDIADTTSDSDPVSVYRNIGIPFMSIGDNHSKYVNYLVNGGGTDLNGSGLYADLTKATPMSVNELRFSFALQKMLERDALYGSRYNEFLLGHFGVTSPDSRLQITEYLGGGRIPIQIQQVAQTSQSTDESALATLSGYSLSNGYSHFTKGFVEHGFVLTVGCVKQRHTYCQGVDKLWTRKSRNDFYDPLFANIGEQPVYTSQIYYDNNLNGEIFGYNEAWTEYRNLNNKMTSNMRTTAQNTLDVWHFGDKYDSQPYLTRGFDEETSLYLDRTLSVPSSSMPHFIADLCFKTEAIRVLPTYSVPGLIDHH